MVLVVPGSPSVSMGSVPEDYLLPYPSGPEVSLTVDPFVGLFCLWGFRLEGSRYPIWRVLRDRHYPKPLSAILDYPSLLLTDDFCIQTVSGSPGLRGNHTE